MLAPRPTRRTLQNIGLLVSMTPQAARLLGTFGSASSELDEPRWTTTDLPRIPSGPSIRTPGSRLLAMPYWLSVFAIHRVGGSFAPGGIHGGPPA